METLEKWVRDLFGTVKRRTEKPQEKKYGLPFDDKNKNYRKLYEVRPINQTDELRIAWCLPPIIDHFKTSPLEFWGHIIGHEGKGSLISRLREENLGLELNAGVSAGGFDSNRYSSIFDHSDKVNRKGWQRVGHNSDVYLRISANASTNGASRVVLQ